MYRIQRNWGARLRIVDYHGMQLVELENDLLQIGVLAGKGADIISLEYKPTGIDLVWLAPGGIRNPSEVLVDEQELFRATYPGGWQEMFPNAGPSARSDGVLHPQHGEVFAAPWLVEVVEDNELIVVVRMSIETRRVPCRIEKTFTLRAGESRFRIDERLYNLSNTPLPVMWGHHITFGSPYLDPGMHIRLPDGITVTPHVSATSQNTRRISELEPFPWPIDPQNGLDLRTIPVAGTPSEMLFLTGFGEYAWYEIAGDPSKPTCRIAWDGSRMPVLWHWQESGRAVGYPWYGRLQVTGLEPCTSMPGGIDMAMAAGTVPTLDSGDCWKFWLSCDMSQ